MSRRAQFPSARVERVTVRAHTAALQARHRQRRREIAHTGLDAMVAEVPPEEALEIYREVALALPDRLGLTHEAASLLASKATDCSLAATKRGRG